MNQSAEVFFWLDELGDDVYLGLDLLPKFEDSIRAVNISVMAMEVMYQETMSIKDQAKKNMLDPNIGSGGLPTPEEMPRLVESLNRALVILREEYESTK